MPALPLFKAPAQATCAESKTSTKSAANHGKGALDFEQLCDEFMNLIVGYLMRIL
jgi:hypothetical protein